MTKRRMDERSRRLKQRKHAPPTSGCHRFTSTPSASRRDRLASTPRANRAVGPTIATLEHEVDITELQLVGDGCCPRPERRPRIRTLEPAARRLPKSFFDGARAVERDLRPEPPPGSRRSRASLLRRRAGDVADASDQSASAIREAERVSPGVMPASIGRDLPLREFEPAGEYSVVA